MHRSFLIAATLTLVATGLSAQDAKQPAPPKLDTSRGDKMIAEYFRLETAKLQEQLPGGHPDARRLERQAGRVSPAAARDARARSAAGEDGSEAGRSPARSSTRSSSSRSCTSSRGPGCTSPAICICRRTIDEAAAGDSVRLRPRRRRRRTASAIGNKADYQHHGGVVRPERLRLPDDRHAATRRDRGHSPRHAPLRHVVVAQPRLHAGRRRGVELHPGARLSGDAAGGRHDPLRRHRPQRRRGL